jgi:hypothetical protein
LYVSNLYNDDSKDVSWSTGIESFGMNGNEINNDNLFKLNERQLSKVIENLGTIIKNIYDDEYLDHIN